MPPVPILSPSDVIKIFQRLDWQVVRQKGSHIIILGKATWLLSRYPTCGSRMRQAARSDRKSRTGDRTIHRGFEQVGMQVRSVETILASNQLKGR